MNKNNIKPSFIISALLTLLISPVLRAQALLVSPVSYWVSALNTNMKSFVYELEKSSQLHLKIPEGTVESETVNLTSRFRLNNVSPDFSTNQFNLEFNIENAEVLAKNVKIQIVSNQDLGFGSAIVHLNVQCSAISIQALNSESLFAKLDKNLQVTSLSIKLPKQSVKTNLIGCTEINGLGEVIQEKVLNYVQLQIVNQQLYQFISDEISLQLTKKLNDVAKSFLGADEKSDSLKFNIDEKLRLWVSTAGLDNSKFTADELSALADVKVTSILFKKTYLESLVRDQMNLEISKKPLYSKLNAGLQKLTCSRWAQFFTWPALMALPKCFNMQIVSKLEKVDLIDPAKLDFNFSLKSWVSAADQKKDIAYFSTTNNVNFSSLQSELTFLKARNLPEFLSWSGRSSRISSGIIGSALQSYLSQEIKNLKSNDTKLKLFSFFDTQKSKFVGADSVLIQLRDN